MQTLISVAIPAYNHARYIQLCLQSVVNQTYQNLELVIIDDGSTDNTAAIIARFLNEHAHRFQRVVFETQNNLGVSATSNKAISLCTGEWVHLLGSDDVIYPNKIAQQFAAITTWADPNLALVYADANYIDENNTTLPKVQKNRPQAGVVDSAYSQLFLQNPITNPTITLKRSAFLAIGGFDETLKLEDWDCWLRLSVHYSIARVPEVLASYRYHPHNTSRNQQLMLEAMLRTFAKFLDNHNELISTQIKKQSFRENLHRLYRWSRKNQPTLLWLILKDALLSPFHTPEARDYRYYAERLAKAV
ncbi:MAG: glycosyltransferase [Sulfuriferula sp.]|nr:glycosyltransferase [Sulfuriferula sp.]